MILFKKRPLIIKHQSGGEVNYYSQYTVNPSPDAPRANVGAMMQKHQASAAPSDTGGGKYEDPTPPDLKGLKIDKDAWIEKNKILQDEIRHIVSTDPEYLTNPKFIEAVDARNILHTSGLDDMEQRFDEHTTAKTHIGDEVIGSQWATKGSRGLYKGPHGKYYINDTKYLNSDVNKDKQGRRIYTPVTFQETDELRQRSMAYLVNIKPDGTHETGSFIGDMTLDNWALNTRSEDNIYKNTINPVFAKIGIDSETKKDELNGVNLNASEFQFTEEELSTLHRNPANIVNILKGKTNKSNVNNLKKAVILSLERLKNSGGLNTLVNNKYQNNPKVKSLGEAYQSVVNDLLNKVAKESNTTIINNFKLGNEAPEVDEGKKDGDGNDIPGTKDLPEPFDALMYQADKKTIGIEKYTGELDEKLTSKTSKEIEIHGVDDVFTMKLMTHELGDKTKGTYSKDAIALSNLPNEVTQRLQMDKGVFVDSGIKVKNVEGDVDRYEWVVGSSDWMSLESTAMVDKSTPIISADVFTLPGKGIVPITEHPRYKQLYKDTKNLRANIKKNMDNAASKKDMENTSSLTAMELTLANLTKEAVAEITVGYVRKNTSERAITVYGQKYEPGETIVVPGMKAKKGAIMTIIYPHYDKIRITDANGQRGAEIGYTDIHPSNREYAINNSTAVSKELYRAIGGGNKEVGEGDADLGSGVRTSKVFYPYVESMVSQARSSGDSPLMMKFKLLWGNLDLDSPNRTNTEKATFEAVLLTLSK